MYQACEYRRLAELAERPRPYPKPPCQAGAVSPLSRMAERRGACQVFPTARFRDPGPSNLRPSSLPLGDARVFFAESVRPTPCLLQVHEAIS